MPNSLNWRPTKAQLRALHALYVRSPYAAFDKRTSTKLMSYRQFRRTAKKMLLDDCLLVPFCGMIVGIEPDGYTHS